MIADLPCGGQRVSCDLPGCDATGDCTVGRNREGNITKAFLPEGWGMVRVLDGSQQFCPPHAERLL